MNGISEVIEHFIDLSAVNGYLVIKWVMWLEKDSLPLLCSRQVSYVWQVKIWSNNKILIKSIHYKDTNYTHCRKGVRWNIGQTTVCFCDLIPNYRSNWMESAPEFICKVCGNTMLAQETYQVWNHKQCHTRNKQSRRSKHFTQIILGFAWNICTFRTGAMQLIIHF